MFNISWLLQSLIFFPRKGHLCQTRKSLTKMWQRTVDNSASKYFLEEAIIHWTALIQLRYWWGVRRSKITGYGPCGGDITTLPPLAILSHLKPYTALSSCIFWMPSQASWVLTVYIKNWKYCLMALQRPSFPKEVFWKTQEHGASKEWEGKYCWGWQHIMVLCPEEAQGQSQGQSFCFDRSNSETF